MLISHWARGEGRGFTEACDRMPVGLPGVTVCDSPAISQKVCPAVPACGHPMELEVQKQGKLATSTSVPWVGGDSRLMEATSQ